MRQALVLGGVPRLTEGREYPRVPLGPGNWRLDVENLDASVLRLYFYKRVPGAHGGVFNVPSVKEGNLNGHVLEGPGDAMVVIHQASSESSINVFATSV